MAIDSLLRALSSDAEHDARQITDAARAEAARIRAESEALVARQCEAALAAHQAVLREAADARRARERRDTRAQSLRARAAFLDRVFAAAEERLPGILDAPSNGPALERLTGEALQFIPDRPAIVRCRSGLASRLRGATDTLGDAQVVSDDAVPEGVIVAASDASVTIDNTLAARLRWLRPSLAIEILMRLEASA